MNPRPSETILVPMDVMSLYTNIPHNDGIEASREAWNLRGTKERLLQINGTAMGTNMAPSC